MLTASRYITKIDPNSDEFRKALREAGSIVAGTALQVYSRHHHFKFTDDEVLFEKLVTAGELALYPVLETEAIQTGLPSCWAFDSDGTPVAIRYADRQLHESSDIDVTDARFLEQLTDVGRQFVDKGLHGILEVNVASALLHGHVTRESTNVKARTQQVLFVPSTEDVEIVPGAVPACWDFTLEGEPFVRGWCVTLHGRYDDDEEDGK